IANWNPPFRDWSWKTRTVMRSSEAGRKMMPAIPRGFPCRVLRSVPVPTGCAGASSHGTGTARREITPSPSTRNPHLLGSPLHLLPSFFDLLALGTILGALSIRLWVFPRAGRTEETVVFASIGGRFTSLLTWSLLLLTATSVAVLVVRAAEISGQPYGAVSRVLPAVLFKTHYGTIWFLRLAALFVLWAGVLAMRRTGGAAAPAAAFVAAAAFAGGCPGSPAARSLWSSLPEATAPGAMFPALPRLGTRFTGGR